MDFQEKTKYERAKKQVEEIKGFYVHLSVYLVVNFILLLAGLGVFDGSFIAVQIPTWSFFTTPAFWGIGILFHWLYAFKPNFKPFKNWEERKIKQYLEEEENDMQNNSSSY